MGNDVATILMVAVILVFFYFSVIAPQKKREKQTRDIQNGVKVGDEIVTFHGMIAIIINISGDVVTVETGPEKVKINMYRWSIKETIAKK